MINQVKSQGNYTQHNLSVRFQGRAFSSREAGILRCDASNKKDRYDYVKVLLTTATLKQVVMQLQQCWACLARSESRCIIRTISADGRESPRCSTPRESSLRWRGEWVETRLRTWSVSCSVDSFPWASWMQH